MRLLNQLGVVGLALLAVDGCSRRPAPERAIEYAFEHPAAKEILKIFLKLDVVSEESYRDLSRRDRYVWDVNWFETEVMNGGVDQYMFNSAGDHAAECLEGSEAIGAEPSHRVLQRAGCSPAASRQRPRKLVSNSSRMWSVQSTDNPD